MREALQCAVVCCSASWVPHCQWTYFKGNVFARSAVAVTGGGIGIRSSVQHLTLQRSSMRFLRTRGCVCVWFGVPGAAVPAMSQCLATMTGATCCAGFAMVCYASAELAFVCGGFLLQAREPRPLVWFFFALTLLLSVGVLGIELLVIGHAWLVCFAAVMCYFMAVSGRIGSLRCWPCCDPTLFQLWGHANRCECISPKCKDAFTHSHGHIDTQRQAHDMRERRLMENHQVTGAGMDAVSDRCNEPTAHSCEDTSPNVRQTRSNHMFCLPTTRASRQTRETHEKGRQTPPRSERSKGRRILTTHTSHNKHEIQPVSRVAGKFTPPSGEGRVLVEVRLLGHTPRPESARKPPNHF